MVADRFYWITFGKVLFRAYIWREDYDGLSFYFSVFHRVHWLSMQFSCRFLTFGFFHGSVFFFFLNYFFPAVSVFFFEKKQKTRHFALEARSCGFVFLREASSGKGPDGCQVGVTQCQVGFSLVFLV